MNQKLERYIDLKWVQALYNNPTRRRQLRNGVLVLVAIIVIFPKISPMLTQVTSLFFEEEEELFMADATVVTSQPFEQSISASGTLRAIQEVDLRSEVSGRVTGLHIEEGERVEQGDLLVKINDNDLQAEKVRLESDIEVMEESESRQRQLFERGGATQEDYDNTLMQLNSLRSEYASIEARIERTEIRAPFDGVVGLTFISDGAYVTSSDDIASLQNMSSMRVDFSVPERYASLIDRGSPVEFEVQGVDSLFTAEVVAVEPQIDPRTRTTRVRAVIDNEEGILNPGAYARIELIYRRQEEAVMVPSVSLIPEDGAYKVMKYESGNVHEKPVTIDVRTSDRVLISDGVAVGDTLLVNGFHQLRDGMAIGIRNLEEIETE
jgi:membrane fusion protein, multidrug efflux system